MQCATPMNLDEAQLHELTLPADWTGVRYRVTMAKGTV
jgi:hypothetical protein